MLSFLDKLFRKIPATMLLETKVGIKPINQIITSDYFNEKIIKISEDIKINQIIAPPDFLKDRYTTIGKNINQWPHYKLIECLDKKLPLDACDYVKRYNNGTLDFRKKAKIFKEWLNTNYQKKLNEMKDGKTFLIKVFNIYDDIYIVADGKHRIAVAAYFNYQNLKFEIIQNTIFDTYFRWIFKKIENKKSYTKHKELFRRAYEFRKKEIDRIRNKWFDK